MVLIMTCFKESGKCELVARDHTGGTEHRILFVLT